MLGRLTDPSGKYRMELLIAGLSIICWGRLTGMEGIWWDDWAWVWHYLGSDTINEFILPFLWLKHRAVGYMLFINFSLFDVFHGHTSAIWSVFRFIAFTINALLIFFIARNVLQDKVVLPAAIAAVYLTSPVVNHLALVTYIYHVFLFFYLLSILLSIKSIASGKIVTPNYLLALLFSLIAMISLESFIFFDVLRPLLFFILIRRTGEDFMSAARRSLLAWLPFLLIGFAVLVEAFTVPQSGPYANVYSSVSLSLNSLTLVIGRYINSLIYIFIKIYSLTIKYALIKERNFLFILISFAAAIYASFAFLKDRPSDSPGSSEAGREAGIAALFGLLTVVVGLFPYALTREAVAYEHHSRHGLLAAVGAAIFFPSFLLSLHHKKLISRKACQALFGLLIFLGALRCNYTTGIYKDNWEHQRSIWWQMIWRAPDIKPNSFMIIDMPWFESPGGGSYVLPPALNLAYAKSKDRSEIFSHYAFELQNAFRTDETNYMAIADKDVSQLQTFRGAIIIYPGNLIAASYQDGYLYLNDEITTPVSASWSDIEFMLSNAKDDRIIYEGVDSRFPYRWILGTEPKHDWRYFYQKANALSGMKDYQGVVRLYDEAQKAGYDLSAILPQNLIPFIKAFYLAGDIDRAVVLLKIWRDSPGASLDRILKLFRHNEKSDNPDLYEWIKKEIGHKPG